MRLVAAAVRAFVVEEDGATLIEYALMIGLIALVVAAVLVSLGTGIRTKFSSASDCLASAASCT